MTDAPNPRLMIDGKRLSEDERRAYLRAEEFEALGLIDYEVPNNALLSLRLHHVTPLAPPPSGAGAEEAATKAHPHREPAQAADESQRDVYGVPALA